MACIVSFSFPLPFRRASEIESKLNINYFSCTCKVPLQKRAFHNVPNQADKKSVERTSVSHANGSAYNMHALGYSQDMLPSRRRLAGFASCTFVIDKNVQTIISGYWSGPDFEDGWGFVEAYVDQTRLVN